MSMKRILLHNALAVRFRRSQRGQSIVLLALAFIALIAFVGLVTDVALLFVRYAALRRAVDSAAIAAAGQVREGTDYAEVATAAQQYIQLHGLEADSVLVETCETDVYQWRLGLGPWEDEDHPEKYDADGKLIPVSKEMGNTELCDWTNPRKLVRVSAQITSPTTFLSLLGFGEFRLEATSVSETAVLDVALVIDTSESMSKETTLAGIQAASGLTVAELDVDRCLGPDFTGSESDPSKRWRWGGCCNDIGRGYVGDGTEQANGITVENGHIWHDANGNGMYDGPGEDGVESSAPRTPWELIDTTDPNREAYTEYFDFTTLVCQPFKQVKDAARTFIKRLDFVRGDRVVFVTFDRMGTIYQPPGEGSRPLIRDEETAIVTLNQKLGVWINDNHDRVFNRCQAAYSAGLDWAAWINAGRPEPEPPVRPFSYESYAPCGNTNIGGGIRAATAALTNPDDIRREAVWVMVVLSDGAANVTDPSTSVEEGYEGISERVYGQYGFCPWQTFCNLSTTPWGEPWPECTSNNPGVTEPVAPFCNDNLPDTRHQCLDLSSDNPWENLDPALCGPSSNYDADDYARDMADYAGLIERAPGVPGNFIAMYSIGFGSEMLTPEGASAAPLLRYIADAGDNGVIDDDLEQDLRDNFVRDNSVPPAELGNPGPCEAVAGDPTAQCGQYYYSATQIDLERAFEQIASRMFTRLSR